MLFLKELKMVHMIRELLCTASFPNFFFYQAMKTFVLFFLTQYVDYCQSLQNGWSRITRIHSFLHTVCEVEFDTKSHQR